VQKAAGFFGGPNSGMSGGSWNGNKLLYIFLRGGNDALNTVIPVEDSAYSLATRGALYISPPAGGVTFSGVCPDNPDLDKAIDLGNGFAGLHPGLHDICSMYNDGELALVHRVGYPNQSRSHFDSQFYWENGVPRNDEILDGVFYRAIVESGLHETQSIPAFSIGDNLPLMLRGKVPMLNIGYPQRFDLLGVTSSMRDKLVNSLSSSHTIPRPVKFNRDLAFDTGDLALKSLDALNGINFDNNEFYDGAIHLFPVNQDSDDKGFNSTTAYKFFASLKYALQILINTDAVIAGVNLPGMDTHNNQGKLSGTHPKRIEWLGWGLHAARLFLKNYGTSGIWGETVVTAMSEFGRRSKVNGSGGTDHGEAGVMFLAGENINGGVYQCNAATWPVGGSGAMFGAKGKYLSRTVDYRSVLGELIRDHIGATQEELNIIIPGYADPAEHLLSGGTAPDSYEIVGELNLI
jgi:uncharacterized protein (DUF1501 family)